MPETQKKPEAQKKPITYADAGVDISSGDRAKQRIKYLAQRTFNRNVLSEIGGFGGLFKLDTLQVQAACPRLQRRRCRHQAQSRLHSASTTPSARTSSTTASTTSPSKAPRPLFFLDYLATGTLDAEVAAEVIVRASRDGCRGNGCALIGGETAEMPGFYADGEYDLAGFIVGAVERSEFITGAAIRAGDVLIGLPSTGLHTNGYSLARKLFFEIAGYRADQYVNALKDKAGAALMTTHRSYLRVDQEADRC